MGSSARILGHYTFGTSPKNTYAYVNAVLTLFERSIEVEFATNNKHNPEHNQSILAIYTVFTAKSAVLLTTLYT